MLSRSRLFVPCQMSLAEVGSRAATRTVLSAGLLACCLAAPPAAAEDYYVNTLADTRDEYCTTLAYPPWSCSLREAVIRAYENPGKDTIHLQPGTYVLTLEGIGDDLAATGDLDILEDVDIVGAGAGLTIIDGNHIDRVFHVFDPPGPMPAPTLQLFDLTIQNGVTHDTWDGYGGGIKVAPGNVLLWRCEVRSNVAERGGGLYVKGYLGPATAVVVDSTFAHNGPEILDPNLPWTDQDIGSGIYVDGLGSEDPTVLIIRSTFHSNRGFYGAAIFCQSGATINMANTTIAGNFEEHAFHSSNCDVVIDSTTFSDNSGYSLKVTGDRRQLRIRNTYVDGTCRIDDFFMPVSEGGNASADTSCGFAQATDFESVPGLVGPLGDHGGYTWTMLPVSPSPLVDNAGADSSCQPEDQRWVTRPQNGEELTRMACDTGAVELRIDDVPGIFSDGFESGDTSGW